MKILPVKPVKRKPGTGKDIWRDPFDRLLAAQALAERFQVVSRDEVFEQYGIERI